MEDEDFAGAGAGVGGVGVGAAVELQLLVPPLELWPCGHVVQLFALQAAADASVSGLQSHA
jgi:hypothetical protein